MKPLHLLFVTFSLLFMLTTGKTQAQQQNISIVSYKNGDNILCHVKIMIKTNAPSSSNIYLLVHPIAVNNWWVQPQFTYDSNGYWHCYAYFGECGKNIGEKFEMIALVNPTQTLVLGQKPTTIPASQKQSSIVEVIRQ